MEHLFLVCGVMTGSNSLLPNQSQPKIHRRIKSRRANPNRFSIGKAHLLPTFEAALAHVHVKGNVWMPVT